MAKINYHDSRQLVKALDDVATKYCDDELILRISEAVHAEAVSLIWPLTAFIQLASEVFRTEMSLAISQCEDLLEKMNIGILQRFVDGKFSGGIRHENDTVHA